MISLALPHSFSVLPLTAVNRHSLLFVWQPYSIHLVIAAVACVVIACC